MIRHATETDLPEIDKIYNRAIAKGFLTAHTEPLNSEDRLHWFKKFSQDNYPIYVFEKNNKVIGWVSVSPYRLERVALNETVEISFYIDFGFHGKGIGTKLVKHCLSEAPKLNKRVFLAIIIEGNEGSITLLEKLGFEQWGYLPEVVNFRNQKRGQVYMGKIVG
tara:strand:- start:9010 stop:9501 length:492 start_codon:yes stop_codon:yes gene_type:complete